MKLFKFELKKLWRQKKLIWLFLLVLSGTAYTFQQSASQQEYMVERAYERTEPLIFEVDQYLNTFEAARINGNLTETGIHQLEQLKDMRSALYSWRNAIFEENWSEVPIYEEKFLLSLDMFIERGAMYSALQGMEREMATQKNAWLIEHELPYEDEMYPISPHLLLTQSTALLLGVLGIAILLLLFGNTITAEKEQGTWGTVKTQPIAKWRQIVAKYASLLTIIFIYSIIVVGIGLLVPFILGDQSLKFQYPQVGMSETSFFIVSTLSYLARAIGLFFCASIFAFSLILFIGAWLNNSFSTLIVNFLTLLLGVFITQAVPILQSAFNPFYLFHFSQILEAIPRNTDWIYPISAITWSILFLLFAIVLPEKEWGQFKFKRDKKPFKYGFTQKHLKVLRSLFVFEWRKLLRKGTFQQIVMFLLLLVMIGYFILSQQTNQQEKVYFETLHELASYIENSAVPMTEKQIDDINEMLELAKKENDEISMESHEKNLENFEKALAFWNDRKMKVDAAIVGFEKGDWLAFYSYQLFENRFMNKELDYGSAIISHEKDMLGQFTLDVSLAEKKWLMKRDIQPVLSGELVPTIHQNWGERHKERKEWEEANRKVDDSGLFSLYLLFNNYVYLVPMILFVLVLGGGFAVERGKRRTLHFLQTQPISTTTIYVGKVLHSSAVALLSCVGLFGIVVLVGTICNRLGDWNYPILYYDNISLANSPEYTGILSAGHGFHLISLGNYLVTSFVLFLLVLLFLMILTNFLSIFIKNTLAVFALFILIVAVGYALSSQYLSNLIHLSPFTYLDVGKITNGEISSSLNHSDINVQTGSLVLITSSLLLIGIGSIVLRNKDKTG